MRKMSRIALRLPTEELDCYLQFCANCGDLTVSEYVRLGCQVFWSAIRGLESSAFDSLKCKAVREHASIQIMHLVVRGLREKKHLVYVISHEEKKKSYHIWCVVEGVSARYGVLLADQRTFFETIGFGGATCSISYDVAHEAVGFYDWCEANHVGYPYRFGEGYL